MAPSDTSDITAYRQSIAPYCPPEILRSIISQVEDRNALLRVCLASQIFMVIAREELYRDMQLVELLSTVKMCRTLTRSTEIAKCVRSMTFDPSRASGTENLTHQLRNGSVLPPFLRLFSRTLRACSGLKKLTLPKPGSYAWILQLHNVSFSLLVFDCQLRIDRSLISFLKRQPTLKVLKLAGLEERLDVREALQCVSKEDCPRLSTLECPHWVAPYFLPHRPIENYSSPFPATDDELALLFRTSSGHLRRVDCMLLCPPSSELIQALALNVGLRHLSIVELHLPDMHHLAEREFDIMDTVSAFTKHTNLQAFSALLSLCTLNITMTAIRDTTVDENIERAAQVIACALGGVCPSLMFVWVGLGHHKSDTGMIRSALIRYLGPEQETMNRLLGVSLAEGGWLNLERVKSLLQSGSLLQSASLPAASPPVDSDGVNAV